MPVPELSIILEAIIPLPETSYMIASGELVKKLPTIFVSTQPSSHQKPIIPSLLALAAVEYALVSRE